MVQARSPRLGGLSGGPRTGANEGGAEEAGVEPTEDARAPSNGFEARAPHRERYSSAPEDAPVSGRMKGGACWLPRRAVHAVVHEIVDDGRVGQGRDIAQLAGLVLGDL